MRYSYNFPVERIDVGSLLGTVIIVNYKRDPYVHPERSLGMFTGAHTGVSKSKTRKTFALNPFQK